MKSKHLTPVQINSLIRLGSLLIPESDGFPSFSKAIQNQDVDVILDELPLSDLSDLKSALILFRFLPGFLLRLLFWTTNQADRFPEPLAAVLRKIEIGFKGIVMTLYYSDSTSDRLIYQKIDWRAQITPLDSIEHPLPTQQDYNAHFEKTPENLKERSVCAATSLEIARRGAITQSALSLRERLSQITSLKKCILKNRDLIIERVQKETQKSRSDVLISEIFGVLDHLSYLEKFATKILKDEKVHTPIALMGKKSFIQYDPLGVVLIISPWNYPFYQAIVPITSASVAGNAVIYKPSEITPLMGLLEQLFWEAGFDPSVFQIVYGDGKTGQELIDARPDKVFFTGSVKTGKAIMKQVSDFLIPVELELGGKDPALVFSDANLKRAAKGIAWGALTNCGQSCTSVERVFVEEAASAQFLELLLGEVKNIRQEVDQNGNSDIGFMTSKAQIQIVSEHLKDALEKGAILHTGSEWDQTSSKIPPLVLTNLNSSMKILNEETFGPVLPLVTFKNEEEAIRLSNDSDYGLSASVWTHDLARAKRVARLLQVGNVSINNVMITEGNPALPFGGVKKSGIGRYKGAMGLRSFCNVKSIVLDKNSGKVESNWYPYTEKKYALFEALTVHLFSGTLVGFLKFLWTGLKLESYSAKAKRKDT